MVRIASIFLSFVLLLASVAPVLAWGDKGHETVGYLAAKRIKPATAAKLRELLKPGESLGSIATWADLVKYRVGEHDPDSDTDAFLQDEVHNKNNAEWHYVDLPLGCPSYDLCPEFTPEHDIVHLINVCIATLQGRQDPNYPLSKRNALRLLVHFIGDLHQPLHVGVGYIDETNPRHIKLARDRIMIVEQNFPGDRGGNDLVIDHDRANLHAFWDFELVSQLMTATHRATPIALAELLFRTPPPSNWRARGPINTWAEQWATDSLKVSVRYSYRDVSITGKRSIPVLRNGEPVVRDGAPVMQTVYDINLPRDYRAVNRNVVRQQLAKGGFRLAMLLDAIFGS
jgi:hypothetical protein